MTEPAGLSGVAAGGDRGDTLRALRDRLAAEIDGSESARDVAALSQRLMDVLEQIDKLSGGKSGGTVLDELAKRRAGSGSPADPPRTKGASKRR